MSQSTTGRGPGSPAQIFAIMAAVIYGVSGIGGLLIANLGLTSSIPFITPKVTLVIFGMNPLHAILHVIAAICWTFSCRTYESARKTNIVMGLVLGLVTVLGLLKLLSFLGIMGLYDPDNFLHLATASLSLYFGTAGAESLRSLRERQHARSRTTEPWWNGQSQRP